MNKVGDVQMSKTAIDLFCGIGGLSLGAVKNGFEVVYALDIKKGAIQIFTDNFPDCNVVTADAYDTPIQNIPECDLLLSGPSCQPYSKAGRKMGVSDPRSNTFLYVFQYLEEKKPRSFLIENVPNLKTMGRATTKEDLGPVFSGFLDKFSELGYDVFYNIIDSADFGVPQRRKRLYIVGFLKKMSVDFPSDLGVSLHTPVIKTVESVLQTKEEIFEYYGEYAKGFWLSDTAVKGMLERKRKNIESGKGFGFRNPLDVNGVFKTFVVGGSGRETNIIKGEVLDDSNSLGYRTLTEVETRRGMGFPDSFKMPFKKKTLCYDVFSNAVTPPVAEYLIGIIKKVL